MDMQRLKLVLALLLFACAIGIALWPYSGVDVFLKSEPANSEPVSTSSNQIIPQSIEMPAPKMTEATSVVLVEPSSGLDTHWQNLELSLLHRLERKQQIAEQVADLTLMEELEELQLRQLERQHRRQELERQLNLSNTEPASIEQTSVVNIATELNQLPTASGGSTRLVESQVTANVAEQFTKASEDWPIVVGFSSQGKAVIKHQSRFFKVGVGMTFDGFTVLDVDSRQGHIAMQYASEKRIVHMAVGHARIRANQSPQPLAVTPE